MAVRDVDIHIRAHDAASAKFSRLGRNVGRMGRAFRALRLAAFGAGVAIGYMAVRLGRAGLQAIGKYEDGLAKVKTMLTGMKRQHFPEWKKAIEEMGLAYGQSMETMTEASYKILSAQIDAATGTKVLHRATQTAVAGFTDTATVVDALIRMMKSYNIETRDAIGVADMLQKTVELGYFDFQLLAQNIGAVGLVAKRAGVGLHELIAAISTATTKGYPAEKVFTDLSMAIRKFQAPSEKGKRLAKEYGIQLGSVAFRTLGLVGALKQLEKLPPDLLGEMFPKKSSVVVGTLLDALPELKANIDKISGASGAMGDALNDAMDSAGFKMRQVAEAWAAISRTIGVALLPTFKAVSQWFLENREEVGKWVGDFFKLIANFGRAIQAVVMSITGAVTAVLDAFGVKWESAAGKAASKFEWLERFVEWAAKGMVTAFAAVEFAIRNLGPIVEYVCGWLKIKFTTFMQDVGKIVYDTLANLWQHMQDNMWNWQKHLGIMIAQVGNYLGNLAQKAHAVMTNLMNPDNLKKEFVRLEAEFQTIGQSLNQDLANLYAPKLGVKLSDKEAKEQLDQLGNDLAAKWKKLLTKRMKPFEIPDVPPPKPLPVVDEAGAKESVNRILDQMKKLKTPKLGFDDEVIKRAVIAQRQQLGAFQSRFLREAPGRSQDPMVRMERHNMRMLEEQRLIRAAAVRTAEATERTADEVEDDEGAEGAGL